MLTASNSSVFMNMKAMLLFLGYISLIQIDAASINSPTLLDSIKALYIPKSLNLCLIEQFGTTGQRPEKAVYTMAIKKGGQAARIDYLKSPYFPQKSVIIQHSGYDIWSRPSPESSIRKIAHHKKKEAINGNGASYWDILPLILVYGGYTINNITPLNNKGVRFLNVNPGETCPYDSIVFQVHKDCLFMAAKFYYKAGVLAKRIFINNQPINKNNLHHITGYTINYPEKNHTINIKITEAPSSNPINDSLLQWESLLQP